MTEVATYTFPITGDVVRTVVVEGEPWFVAGDVCSAIALANTSMALARLDDDEKGVSQIDTPGGRQQMATVSESGLYSLILRSDKPEAKRFKKWVTSEVLPAIRKTGSYSIQPTAVVVFDPTDLDHVAQLAQLAASQKRKIAELEPAAAQAEHFRRADGLTAIGDFCNDLALWAREQHGIKRLLHADIRDYLAEIGLIIRGRTVRNNQPTADATVRGLIRTHHLTYDTNTRGPQEATSARLTPKGWGYAWDKATARIAEHGQITPPKTIERSAA